MWPFTRKKHEITKLDLTKKPPVLPTRYAIYSGPPLRKTVESPYIPPTVQETPRRRDEDEPDTLTPLIVGAALAMELQASEASAPSSDFGGYDGGSSGGGGASDSYSGGDSGGSCDSGSSDSGGSCDSSSF